MTVIYILVEAEKKAYRKMVGYFSAHHGMLSKIVLSKSSSKNTTWRAYVMIPKSYLYDIHQKIINGVQAGLVAGDSIGYSNNCSVLACHDLSMVKRQMDQAAPHH